MEYVIDGIDCLAVMARLSDYGGYVRAYGKHGVGLFDFFPVGTANVAKKDCMESLVHRGDVDRVGMQFKLTEDGRKALELFSRENTPGVILGRLNAIRGA